jgi:hypothetical protein
MQRILCGLDAAHQMREQKGFLTKFSAKKSSELVYVIFDSFLIQKNGQYRPQSRF